MEAATALISHEKHIVYLRVMGSSVEGASVDLVLHGTQNFKMKKQFPTCVDPFWRARPCRCTPCTLCRTRFGRGATLSTGCLCIHAVTLTIRGRTGTRCKSRERGDRSQSIAESEQNQQNQRNYSRHTGIKPLRAIRR
jgi:hypothetical protein